MGNYYGWKLKSRLKIWIKSENELWESGHKTFGIQDPMFYPEFHTSYYNEKHGLNGGKTKIKPDFIVDLGTKIVRIPVAVTTKLNGSFTKTELFPDERKLNPQRSDIIERVKFVTGVDITDATPFHTFISTNYDVDSSISANRAGYANGSKDEFGPNKGKYNELIKRLANFMQNYDPIEECATKLNGYINDNDRNFVFNNMCCLINSELKSLDEQMFGFELEYEANDGSKIHFVSSIEPKVTAAGYDLYVTPENNFPFLNSVYIENNKGQFRMIKFAPTYALKDVSTAKISVGFQDIINNIYDKCRDENGNTIRDEENNYVVNTNQFAKNTDFGKENYPAVEYVRSINDAGIYLSSGFNLKRNLTIEQESEIMLGNHTIRDVSIKGNIPRKYPVIIRDVDSTDFWKPKLNEFVSEVSIDSPYADGGVRYTPNIFYGKPDNAFTETAIYSPKYVDAYTKSKIFEMYGENGKEYYNQELSKTSDPDAFYGLLDYVAFLFLVDPDISNGYEKKEEDEKNNPYEGNDDTNEPQGGDGTFDNTTDKNDIPTNPPSLVTMNGAPTKCYYLTESDIINFGKTLFNIGDNFAELLRKFTHIFSNPIESIITYHTVPVIPNVGTRATIYFGNFGLGSSAYTISNEYVTFDCGSVNIKEYYGNFLDYDTKAEIYLPYIGFQGLNIDDIMNTTVSVKYKINVITGSLICFISCDGDIRYQFSGNCSEEMALSSTSNNLLSSGLTTIGTAIAGYASGGAAGLTGNLIASSSNIKESIQHGSGLSSSCGSMGIRHPYIILTRPRMAISQNYGKLKGYPLGARGVIGNYSGFSVIDTNTIKGPMTADEKEEIRQLLKNGVKL